MVSSPERISTLTLILTSGCNLACRYCFQNDKRGETMPWEVLRGGIDLALTSAEPSVQILFLGGEPLLEFDLLRKGVEYAESRDEDGRLRYGIVTNGLPLSRERIEFLARYRFDTQISFDGVPSSQDDRGEGTFPALDRLLETLAGDWPRFLAERITVGITLTPRNLPQLRPSVRYLLGRGVGQIAVTPIFTDSTSWDPSGFGELEGILWGIRDDCLRVWERTGSHPFLPLQASDGTALPRDARRSMCGAPSGAVPTVDPLGRVHGCATFVSTYQRFPETPIGRRLPGLEIGHLTDPGFLDSYATFRERCREIGIFDDKQDKYGAFGSCGDCPALAECSVCPTSIAHAPGNPDPRRVPDFPCAWNLASHRVRRRMPPDRVAGEAPTASVRSRRLAALLGRTPTRRGP